MEDIKKGELYYDAAVGEYYTVKEKRDEEVLLEDYFEGEEEIIDEEETEDFYLIRSDPMDIE